MINGTVSLPASLPTIIGKIVDDGIAAAKADYSRPDQKQKLEGSILGFEECRHLGPEAIRQLSIDANARSMQALHEQADDYWYWRCRTLEIEWVANVLSSVLYVNGRQPITTPTARGMLKAAEILGVKEK